MLARIFVFAGLVGYQRPDRKGGLHVNAKPVPHGRASDLIRSGSWGMSKAEVILYTRPGCHLCDEAKRAIENSGCAESYTLTEVNIETSEQLLDQYRNEIPVITINGVEAFRHRVNSEEFRRKLLS